ncbi:hypothetical protein GF342_02245 [Candidatus Woesearchaeota archaeon]|nr:hypothetical protein [Candidatus Woesearchaeota archaeon]
MEWSKFLYIVIIAMLYVPMVFLGANAFFPKFAGGEYYRSYAECYDAPVNPELPNQTEEQARKECYEQDERNRQAWEEEFQNHEAFKYVFIALFNLVILGLAVWWQSLSAPVALGLFFGSTIATFSATLAYFDTRSKLGFGIVVITFFVVLYFVSRMSKTSRKKRKK